MKNAPKNEQSVKQSVKIEVSGREQCGPETERREKYNNVTIIL